MEHLPTLKIGGHRVKVKLDPHMPEGMDAEYQSDNLLIRICSDVPPTIKESSLIHEIFHVLNGTFDSEVLGHALMDSLAEQLYQVLADNGLLNTQRIHELLYPDSKEGLS